MKPVHRCHLVDNMGSVLSASDLMGTFENGQNSVGDALPPRLYAHILGTCDYNEILSSSVFLLL